MACVSARRGAPHSPSVLADVIFSIAAPAFASHDDGAVRQGAHTCSRTRHASIPWRVPRSIHRDAAQKLPFEARRKTNVGRRENRAEARSASTRADSRVPRPVRQTKRSDARHCSTRSWPALSTWSGAGGVSLLVPDAGSVLRAEPPCDGWLAAAWLGEQPNSVLPAVRCVTTDAGAPASVPHTGRRTTYKCCAGSESAWPRRQVVRRPVSRVSARRAAAAKQCVSSPIARRRPSGWLGRWRGPRELRPRQDGAAGLAAVGSRVAVSRLRGASEGFGVVTHRARTRASAPTGRASTPCRPTVLRLILTRDFRRASRASLMTVGQR
jgi:hypothetical protein